MILSLSKYQEWMAQQPEEFIKETHAGAIPLNFCDEKNLKGISLEELEQLDNKFINNPEGL